MTGTIMAIIEMNAILLNSSSVPSKNHAGHLTMFSMGGNSQAAAAFFGGEQCGG